MNCILKLVNVGGVFRCEPSYKRPKNDSPFINIPEEIFIKVCGFLSMADIWKMGRVCTRWYSLTRSESICGHVDIASLNLPRKKAHKMLLSLPECVKELRFGYSTSYSKKHHASVPYLFYKLRESFPHLDVLIIENILLWKTGCNAYLSDGFMMNCKVPIELQVRGNQKSLIYSNEQKDADFYHLVDVLQNLTVLSLRNSIIAINDNVNSRIPQSTIKVLDLTRFLCATDSTIKALCQLPLLEELYLAGTSISVNGVCIILKEIPKLKILDLDDTIVGGETFEVLKDYGQSLVELYLGRTAIRDCDLIDLDEESFPVLKKMCLQRTTVSRKGLKKLLILVQSLIHVDVFGSKVHISWILDQPVYIRAKLIYDGCYETDECDHFLQNTFNGAF